MPIISHICPYNYTSPCGEDFQILQKGYVRAEASTAFLVQAWSSHVLICFWMCFDTCMMLVGGLEHVLLFHILGIIAPTDFRGGGNHQPDVFWILVWCVWYVFDMCLICVDMREPPWCTYITGTGVIWLHLGTDLGSTDIKVYLLPPVDPEISWLISEFLSLKTWFK